MLGILEMEIQEYENTLIIFSSQNEYMKYSLSEPILQD